MDRDLIVQALKSTCGNRNFRFQVIVQDSKLHIYVNRKQEYNPDYSLLTDRVTSAIAGLALDSLEGIWIYSRKLGEVEPDWQIFVEPPLEVDIEDMDMDTVNSSVLEGEFFTPEDSAGDTGLLENTGFFHSKPLKESEINTFVEPEADSDPTKPQEEEEKTQGLSKYCFVVNKKILTGDIIPPEKEIVRLVKFFHHLSDNNQQKILPLLEQYFQKATMPDLEKFPVAVKKWLTQITELNDENRSNAAIWLSRYCFDSEGTLTEFKTMEEKKVAQAKAARKAQRSSTEYSFTPATSPISTKEEEFNDLSESKFQVHPAMQQWLIPLVWTVATVILIVLGIFTHHSQKRIAYQQVPSVCQTTIGSSNYCRLGVNLAGENLIQKTSANIFPLSEITETVAKFGCQRFANVKAENLTSLDPQKNPVISSHGEKIFPNIYVVQAVQQNATQPGNVRVGCVYTTGQGERSPKKLASDVIPLNWPTEHYQQQESSSSNFSFGIYTNPINLGLYTLFSAIGLAIASEFKLGLTITNRPRTIYLVALILGCVQLIAVNLPMLNLLASIIFSILAILIVSQYLKSFQLHWDYGYPLIASGVLTIIAVQFLLYGIFLQVIGGFV